MSDLVKALREINNRLTAGIQTDTYGMVQEINRAANELESLQSQLTEANKRLQLEVGHLRHRFETVKVWCRAKETLESKYVLELLEKPIAIQEKGE